MILSRYLQIATGIALALALMWGARVDHLRAQWKSSYEELSVKAGKVLVSIKLASGNEDLTLEDAPDQVYAIADSRRAWKDTSVLQSARIDELAVETEKLKALNTELRAKAEAAIAKRDTAIRRLQDSSLTPGDRADCASQLRAAEDALNLVYDEGL